MIQSVLGEYKTKNAEELIKGIRKLMKYNIVDYVERTDYPATIRKLLKDKRIQISALLLQKIREHSDMEFKSCYKPFVGKKLEDIANVIETDATRERVSRRITRASDSLLNRD